MLVVFLYIDNAGIISLLVLEFITLFNFINSKSVKKYFKKHHLIKTITFE